MKKHLRRITILTSVIFSMNTMTLAAHGSEPSNNVFKVVPNIDNPKRDKYLAFQVLPDKSVSFYSCEESQCLKVNDSPIPGAKFEKLLQPLLNKNVSKDDISTKKSPTLKEFLVGAGVTHLGVSLAIGISTALTGGIGLAPSAFEAGLLTGGLYALAPAAPLLGTLGSVASVGFDLTAGGVALVGAAAALPVIAVAVVGGASYLIYKKVASKHTPASANIMMVNLTQEDLLSLVRSIDSDHTELQMEFSKP